MPNIVLNKEDEARLRELAEGIAKDIEEPVDLIKRLGFSASDYEQLSETRSFKNMLDTAMSEWQGANNTHKRAKLKAAINVEQALPSFHAAMTNPHESLGARVKAMEVMMRIGGLGNPEPVAAGAGNAFNLTIQLSDNGQQIVVNSGGAGVTQEELPVSAYPQSRLLDGVEFEEL